MKTEAFKEGDTAIVTDPDFKDRGPAVVVGFLLRWPGCEDTIVAVGSELVKIDHGPALEDVPHGPALLDDFKRMLKKLTEEAVLDGFNTGLAAAREANEGESETRDE